MVVVELRNEISQNVSLLFSNISCGKFCIKSIKKSFCSSFIHIKKFVLWRNFSRILVKMIC